VVNKEMVELGPARSSEELIFRDYCVRAPGTWRAILAFIPMIPRRKWNRERGNMPVGPYVGHDGHKRCGSCGSRRGGAFTAFLFGGLKGYKIADEGGFQLAQNGVMAR